LADMVDAEYHVRPSFRDRRDIRGKANKAAPTRRLTRQWPFCC
jgi:hypothetical protein